MNGASATANITKSRKLLFAILTIALALGGLEGAARIYSQQKSETSPLTFVGHDWGEAFPTAFDKNRFWKLPPNTKIPDYNEYTNNRGFRGAEATAKKGDGVRRILCLGDSSVFGFGVTLDESFCYRLQRWFDATAGKTEIVNGGVPAYSVFQILQTWRGRAAGDGADIVMIYAGAWNDYTPAIGAADEAIFVKMQQSPARTWAAFEWMKSIFTKSGGDARAQDRYRRLFFDSGARPDGPRVPPERFESLVGELITEIRAAGAEPIVIIPPAPRSTRERFADSDAYAKILQKKCAELGAPAIDVRGEFVKFNETDAELFLDMIHPTLLGHARIAKFVAADLARRFQINHHDFEHFDDPPILLKSMEGEALFFIGDPPREAPAAEFTKNHRRWILAPAPHTIAFRNVKIPPAAALTGGLLLKTGDSGGQARFEVSAARAGEPAKVIFEFAKDITIKNDWSPVWLLRADLAEFAGETVTLTISARAPAPSAAWLNLQILPYH